MNFNIDIAIFIGFLLLNLLVGLSYGRGVKTIQDYALGGRNFSTGAIVATVVATWISGSGFFIAITKTYSDGLYYLIASSGMGVGFILTAYILIPRMGSFLGKTSIAEVMGELYGQKIRIITAITGIITDIGIIAVQFKVYGQIFSYFLGFDQQDAIIAAGIITTIYSSVGGIRAVTFTDVLQFATFGIGIPLVVLLIWNQLSFTEGFNIANAFSNPKFDYREVLNIRSIEFWQMIPLMLYFAMPSMGPSLCQRIMIGRNLTQVKKAFIIAGVIIIFVKLFISWIPFLIFNINPNIEKGQLISYIIDNYTYPGLKGIVIIGVVAMAMSTADSRINSSAVLFGNDFCIPLNIAKHNELLLSKIFAFILGAFGIILALSTQDLLNLILKTQSFYMPIVTAPLVLSIFGFRTSTKSVVIGMLAGFTTVVIWNILDIKIDCIIIAMSINAIFVLASHYLLKQPGGWGDVKVDNTENYNSSSKGIDKLIHSIRAFNFIEFCKRTAPKNEFMYTGLGIYFIFYTFSTMYSTQVALLKENGRMILTFYQIMMCTGTIIAMYPIWPPRIKHEIIVQVAWNIVIFYMFAFFSCFFVMLSNFGQLQFAIFTLNILLAAILVGWKLAAIMMIVGSFLSVKLYKFYAGVNNIDISIGSPEFIFMYSLVLIGSALIIFIKPKEEQYALTEEKNDHLSGRIEVQELELRKALALKQEFIRNVTHEYNAPMTGILSMAEIAHESRNKLTKAELASSIEVIYKSALRLNNFDSNISILAKLSKEGFELKKEKINFGDLVHERVEICRKLYEDEREKDKREFDVKVAKGVEIEADRYYLTQTLDNLIINAITYCKKGKITIKLERNKTSGEIKFVIIDEGIGIPQKELFDVFDEFKVSSKTHTPAGGRGVGLAVAKKVVEAHGGRIWAESDGKHGASFHFVF